MSTQLCLGIESTAHTFGVAVVTFDGDILSNERAMYTTETGGMIPNDVAKHHERVKDDVLQRALTKAGVTLNDIHLVSFAHGPGLAPSLRIGKDFAIKLSEGKHVIGINHCIAHLTIGDLICKTKDPVYLYVSGVNTQVIAKAGKRMRVFGETLDIGLGNALDKFGREAGLGFPAGPKMEELAKNGTLLDLPYTVKGMDVSFAGLVTKATQLLKRGAKVEDVCCSLQEVTFAMLGEISERALAHCEKNELLLIGGVAANKRLAQMLDTMCKERGATFSAVPLQYAGDQAAMIAWQGILEWEAGTRMDKATIDIRPYERTDDVDVTWR